MKVFIRLPNESCYDEVDIDMSLFTVTSDWPDEMFGWYKGNLIAIKKQNKSEEGSIK
jgi:hypothetical protein